MLPGGSNIILQVYGKNAGNDWCLKLAY